MRDRVDESYGVDAPGWRSRLILLRRIGFDSAAISGVNEQPIAATTCCSDRAVPKCGLVRTSMQVMGAETETPTAKRGVAQVELRKSARPDPAVIIGSCVDRSAGLRCSAVRFPESDRVIYTRNPLVEVICQVRFPRILKVEAELPVAFQESIRGTYQNLKEIRTTRIPEQLAQAVGVDPGPGTTFEFSESGGVWKVSLGSNFLALTTSRYTRWEEFRRRLRVALDVLQQTYAVSKFTRVGLRYKDLISRSQTGLPDEPWTTCIRNEVLGELTLPEFAGAAHASRQLVLALDYPSSAVRFSHGLVEAEDDAGAVEDCYLIDADFYTDVETERADAEALLDRFNEESGRLFRWCITRRLHDAMGPVTPSAELDVHGLDPG